MNEQMKSILWDWFSKCTTREEITFLRAGILAESKSHISDMHMYLSESDTEDDN